MPLAAFPRILLHSPARAFLHIRLEENLELRLWEDDRADVAAFHHYPRPAREGALHFHELGPDLRQARHLCGGQGDLWRAQARGDIGTVYQYARLAITRRDPHVGFSDQFCHGGLFVRIYAGGQNFKRRGAVRGSAIHVHESQTRREHLRHRAFSRTCGTINRDYERLSHGYW